MFYLWSVSLFQWDRFFIWGSLNYIIILCSNTHIKLIALKHYNIPVFIPELACPFRCIYCNQYNITGSCNSPELNQVNKTIETHLSTINPSGTRVEVAFFGGSFTGLTRVEQNRYLNTAKPWIEKKLIQGIRISTRPDYITSSILENLKENHVTAIELGAQSMNESVLNQAGRGHTAAQVVEASRLIKSFGFELGLQMMTGLPGDSPQSAMATATLFVSLGADSTRIYPALVLRDTELAVLYKRGFYMPQTIDEAVDLCVALHEIFQKGNVKILRTGLHPSEGFYSSDVLLAGPFHPSFGELVSTQIWNKRFQPLATQKNGKSVNITVYPKELNSAIGYKASNRKWLENSYKRVSFTAQPEIAKGRFYADIY